MARHGWRESPQLIAETHGPYVQYKPTREPRAWLRGQLINAADSALGLFPGSADLLVRLVPPVRIEVRASRSVSNKFVLAAADGSAIFFSLLSLMTAL